jgi:hypothetical protein
MLHEVTAKSRQQAPTQGKTEASLTISGGKPQIRKTICGLSRISTHLGRHKNTECQNRHTRHGARARSGFAKTIDP